jgi:hypothetical protein
VSFNIPSPLDNEAAQAKKQEAQTNAARYAERHPDDVERRASVGVVGTALRRVRDAITRRS